MLAEKIMLWDGAVALRDQDHFDARTKRAVYLAEVHSKDGQELLEGQVSTEPDRQPRLRIPLSTSLSRYRQEDIRTIDRCMQQGDFFLGGLAVDAIIAYRNLRTLGFDLERSFDSIEAHLQGVFKPYAEASIFYSSGGNGFSRVPNSYTLHLNDPMRRIWEGELVGTEAEVAARFAGRVEDRYPISLTPINYQQWLQDVQGDFSRLRLF